MGKLGQWLQVGANIGILAGLVLVALQMKQNTDMLELQIRKQETDNFISGSLSQMGDNFPAIYEKHLVDPLSLTYADMRALESSLWGNSIYRWWSTYRMYEDGLVDSDAWKIPINTDLEFTFGNPYAQAWWQDVRTIPELPEELVAYIDMRMENIDAKGSTKGYDRILKALRQREEMGMEE